MIKTFAAVVAAAAMFTGVGASPAEASHRCSCAVKKHHVRHHVKKRVIKRRVVKPAPPVVIEEVVVAEKVVKVDQCNLANLDHLPDPARLDHPPEIASSAENVIAEALNASLDVWRTCGWSGYEQPAAAFVCWSRTHVTTDPKDPTHAQIAWKPYARESFGRTEALTDPIERSRYCADIRPDRTQMRADMDRQMDALAKAHQASHD